MSGLGIVVIGRNEGERLIACLSAIAGAGEVVYVDSGSTDRSREAAAGLGARVVALDMSRPFTAARARNAGVAALSPACSIVQFVDGDCVLQPAWLATARAALAGDPALAAVFGRRREIRPEASRYNWLCDREWAVAPGIVRFFGGDVMMRRAALEAAGGYPSEMIAGEEPDLAIRMRAGGWTIRCLPAEMTVHDAAIYHFGQWWRRTLRSGHAYAELTDRHRGSPLHDYGRRLRSVAAWGLALPAAAILALLAAAALRSAAVAMLGLLLLLLPFAQFARLVRRERRTLPLSRAATMAWFLILAKYAQAAGALRYWRGKIGGRRAGLIEYKGGEAAA